MNNFLNCKLKKLTEINVENYFQDVQKLYSKLGNPIGKFRVPLDEFNHLDFLWGKDANILLYDKILSLLSRYKDVALKRQK